MGRYPAEQIPNCRPQLSPGEGQLLGGRLVAEILDEFRQNETYSMRSGGPPALLAEMSQAENLIV